MIHHVDCKGNKKTLKCIQILWRIENAPSWRQGPVIIKAKLFEKDPDFGLKIHL